MYLTMTDIVPLYDAPKLPEPEPGLVTCSIETVRTPAEFDALEREWSDLVEAAHVSVFQSYEWLRTWWTHFGAGRSLWIQVFKHRGEIVGIGPLFAQREKLLGVPVATHIQFIGCGLSDYTDMIIRPGYEQSVLESFARHLTTIPKDWDILDFEDINESSVAARLLPVILRNQHIDVYQYRGNVCPYVTLPEKAEDLLKELGATSRYNFRRKFRNLESQFKTEVKLFRRPEDGLEQAVKEFSFIHGERWKSLGFPSAFDDASHIAFHVEIAKKFAARDWLRMIFLHADGVPVAVTFCFNYRQRIYMYQSNAHGSDAVMKCSPGFLVRSIAMVEGIAERMRVFDFLRGEEDYKYREWNAVDSQNWLFRARSPLSAGKLRFLLFLVKELCLKMRTRVTREVYEFRRMRILKKPTGGMLVNYLLTKVFHLTKMGIQFMIRHSPIARLRSSRAEQNEGPTTYKSLHASDTSAVLHYTLGEKLFRTIRSFKLNNLIWKARVRRHAERILEERTSKISGAIKVVERGPERLLLLDGQTCSIYFSNGRWSEAKREYWGGMSQSPFGIPPNASVLLLGLGGGTTIHLLRQSHPTASVTALEFDPEIIEIAKKHFGVENLPGVTIIEGDATAIIRKLRAEGARYDLILDDIFYNVTGKLSHGQQATIKHLMSMLNPGGTATFQRAIDSLSHETSSDRFAQSLRDLGYEVRVRKMRQRWTNDVIYCRNPRP